MKRIFIKIFTVIFLSATILIGILIMLFNSTFGNYVTTVYDLFLNPILGFFYFLLSIGLILVSINFVKNKKIYFALFVPFVFWLISNIDAKNLHKDVILKGEINNRPKSEVLFFDDNTFEIKIIYNHVTEVKKGVYEIVNDEFILLDDEIESITHEMYTNNYKLINDSVLESSKQGFKNIILIKNFF